MTTTRERSEKIAALNDQLRKNPGGNLGLLHMTAGIAALGPEFWEKVLLTLVNLAPEDFDKDNDPYGERDFSVFEVDGEKLYGKIDYYQKGSRFTAGAETPDDPATTDRVLTVMLSEEY